MLKCVFVRNVIHFKVYNQAVKLVPKMCHCQRETVQHQFPKCAYVNTRKFNIDFLNVRM